MKVVKGKTGAITNRYAMKISKLAIALRIHLSLYNLIDHFDPQANTTTEWHVTEKRRFSQQTSDSDGYITEVAPFLRTSHLKYLREYQYRAGTNSAGAVGAARVKVDGAAMALGVHVSSSSTPFCHLEAREDAEDERLWPAVVMVEVEWDALDDDCV